VRLVIIKIKKFFQEKSKNLPYRISYEPLPNNYDDYTNAEYAKLSRRDMILRGFSKALKILLDLHERNPQVPTFMYNIATCYSAQGKEDVAEKYLEKIYRAYPDYLFGRCERALQALKLRKPEYVLSIFNNCLDLKSLYPERDFFHISEGTTFLQVIGWYYVSIFDIQKARMNCDIMEELVGEDDEKVRALSKTIKKVVNLTKKNMNYEY